ncbi:MAG TPA: HlyD family efflux transporter periplasmic adaptor subunit [Gemmatimonadaceae bacterium]|nr:HlyD family efflux transporter periplasmic adaptor subunit [Gemmatimonadaceae bacterium]
MIQLSRRRWMALLGAVLLVAAVIAWYLAPATAAHDGDVIVTVKRGDFDVVVTTSGELQARNFVRIQGPLNAQQAEIYQMKISSIIPEGTIVKEGDIVAQLDRSTIAAKVAEVSLALQKAEAQYTQAQLDSTLTLSQARDQIHNLELALEEARLTKEQSTYEAPTIRRQADISLEKAQRALAQAKLDYKTKTGQAVAKMAEVSTEVERQRNKLKLVQDVAQGFTIRAPAPGMVIYVKEWNGKKRGTGSPVSPWDPSVATLPDLTHMESVTYVNEIDVRKVAVGQPVTISLDADPSKQLTGKVISVANVGEQRPNNDAKVFEVKVEVEQADTTLRPGMTTSNAIETLALHDVLSVPLEAVVIQDSVPYVYKVSGPRVVRQEVETGVMNENEIVIARGLSAGDQVLLDPPVGKEKPTTVSLPPADSRRAER